MNTSHGVIMELNAKPLCSAHHRLAAGIAVLALGWPVLASADCVDMRKPTAGEMEFHSRAIATLVAALPPVPVGGTSCRTTIACPRSASSARERRVTSFWRQLGSMS